MNNHYEKSKGLHLNYEIITKFIENGSKILDLGCGDGTLLKMLIERKNCTGTGIEIDQQNAIQAIEKGLSIIQGDIDEGLKDFSDNEYDYIILNQTLQSTEKPDYVIEEMLRAGKKAVVSFPNFAYWKVRFYLFFNGKMPKSNILPFEWYNTPNIHLLTIKDFFEFCKKRNIKILKEVYMNKARLINNIGTKWHKNLFTEEAIFVISK
ncbi:TPA: methionine biosynthesis protein MetW [Candidatus Spyradomonas excrementavium]|nr:methionine biosynthesis protein MetW [Candidatus Spyradomonas excrementavium]